MLPAAFLTSSQEPLRELKASWSKPTHLYIPWTFEHEELLEARTHGCWKVRSGEIWRGFDSGPSGLSPFTTQTLLRKAGRLRRRNDLQESFPDMGLLALVKKMPFAGSNLHVVTVLLQKGHAESGDDVNISIFRG